MSKVLVLGGTQFVGKHLVEHLLTGGHHVTLCNRGKSDPGRFADLPHIVGDRDGDMSGIAGDWDTVYDVTGYTPQQVATSAQHLDSNVHYVFVSTVSVYADLSVDIIDETSPVHQRPLDQISEDPAQAYGELKALAETVVRDRFVHHTIIRPGIIAGPDDPTDRVTYWATRFAEPGEHLFPADADQMPCQFTDVTDLAAFMAALHNKPQGRALNAVGIPTTLGAFVDQVIAATATRRAISPKQMDQHGLRPWRDMPMWLPSDEPDRQGLFAVDGSAAREAGLSNRPTAQTAAAILTWADRKRMRDAPKVGLTIQREQDLLGEL